MTNPDDQELDNRIAALSREAQPEGDLWPSLRAALPARKTTAHMRGWLQIAAGVALFAAGLLAGRSLDAPPSAAAGDPIGGLAAAAEVQRAGAAYVKALADLRVVKQDLPPAVVAQGRGAAIATLAGAAWELKQLGSEDETATRILALARLDREER